MTNIIKKQRLVKRKSVIYLQAKVPESQRLYQAQILENLQKLTDCLTENLPVLTASVTENAEQLRITNCMRSKFSHSCRIYELKVRIYSKSRTKSELKFRLIAVYTNKRFVYIHCMVQKAKVSSP